MEGRRLRKNQLNLKRKNKMSEVFLLEVPEDKKFYCSDGTILSNMEELASHLGKMDDAVFHFHAEGEKNDFCSWTYDVIGDVKLAESLAKAKDKKSASRRTKARITAIKKSKTSTKAKKKS